MNFTPISMAAPPQPSLLVLPLHSALWRSENHRPFLPPAQISVLIPLLHIQLNPSVLLLKCLTSQNNSSLVHSHLSHLQLMTAQCFRLQEWSPWSHPCIVSFSHTPHPVYWEILLAQLPNMVYKHLLPFTGYHPDLNTDISCLDPCSHL